VRSTDHSEPGAVVVGASYRALGVVRSLGRRGIPVRVVRSDEHVLANVSRHVRTRGWRVVGEEQIADELLRIARVERRRGAVLIPTHEVDAEVISAHHATLADAFRLSVQPSCDVAWAYDKRETHKVAEELGIDHPRTRLPERIEDLATLDLRFPVIIKPAFRPREIELRTPKAWPAGDAAELECRYRAAAQLMPADRLMVQELVPGGPESQLSYAALCRHGEVLASIAACRARQKPMDFGQSSTFVRTIDEGELEEPSQRLLRATRFTGLVEVEFKRSVQDGGLKLLDVNPRTWGWMSIGPRAGVDFPYLLWRMLSGRDVRRTRARPGVRWVRVTQDLPVAMHEMLLGRMSALAYAASLRPPIEPAVLSAEDPLPGLLEPVLLSSLGARRVWRARAPRRLRADGQPRP
jgi:D-aspartate ligase